MSEPLVTVRTLVYNTGRFVIDAFDSLLQQDYHNIEHIIIDDCSTDNSVAVIEEWLSRHKHKCLFIKHSRNMGMVRSLNEINRHATGKYITGLMDDLWEPNRLRTLVDKLEELGDEYSTVFSDARVVDENGIVTHESYYRWKGFMQVPDGSVFEHLLRRNYIIAPSNLTRLLYIREMQGYDETLVSEDKDMWLKLSNKYKFHFINQPLLQYRVRKSSMSRTKQNEILKTHILIYKKHLGSTLKRDSLIVSNIIKAAIRMVRHNPSNRSVVINLLLDLSRFAAIRRLIALLKFKIPIKFIQILFKLS